MKDEKPINEKICEAIAQIMILEDSAAEIRAEIADRKREIREKIKELGFNVKAFNKVLESFRIQRDSEKKEKWLELQKEIAKIQVALRQPSLFEYARAAGVEGFK